MKCLTLALVVFSAITMIQRASAQEVNASHNETAPVQTPGQAATLVTQPAMINKSTDYVIDQNNRLKQISNSISPVHSQPSQSINPLDFLTDPSASFKKFFQEQPNQTPEPRDPFGVAKVPPLDSNRTGKFSVTVSHF